MEIVTAGRTNTEDLFGLSDLRSSKTLNHTPVLLFVPQDGNRLNVVIVHKPISLLEYQDDIQAMMQWQGNWRSDFFQFTIGELRKYITDHPKTDYQVI